MRALLGTHRFARPREQFTRGLCCHPAVVNLPAMTIAACYLSSEGVVIGADSTSTVFVANPSGVGGAFHHLNYAQKIFEVGENSSIGVALWGIASIGNLSHRTFIAQFADEV